MNLTPVIRQRFFDHSTGAPLSGGQIFSYQAGTTTPQNTYTDQGGGTPNANPVVLDANGECNMWIDPSLSYKFILQDSLGNVQWTIDNVIGLLTAGSVNTASLVDGAVTTVKLADNAVTSAKLSSDASVDGNRAVQTNHIRNSAVTIAKLDSTSTLSPDQLVNLGLTATVAASAMTIAIKNKSGNDPSASDPVTMAMRSSTATTGTSVQRQFTAAASIVIPSTATLGSTSGNANWIYVYAIDNAGTLEIAVSGTRFVDEGSLVTTTAISTGSTSKFVLYSNTLRTSVAVRLLGRIKNTQATAGTWAAGASEISLWPFERNGTRASLYLDGNASGTTYGSTNNKVLRYGTSRESVGADAPVFADSVTLGSTATIVSDGMYDVTAGTSGNGAAVHIAIVWNGSAPTTSSGTPLTYAQGARGVATAPASGYGEAHWSHFLSAGDVITVQGNANSNSNDASNFLSIVKTGY